MQTTNFIMYHIWCVCRSIYSRNLIFSFIFPDTVVSFVLLLNFNILVFSLSLYLIMNVYFWCIWYGEFNGFLSSILLLLLLLLLLLSSLMCNILNRYILKFYWPWVLVVFDKAIHELHDTKLFICWVHVSIYFAMDFCLLIS